MIIIQILISLVCVAIIGFCIMFLCDMPSSVRMWIRWGVMDTFTWVGVFASALLLSAAIVCSLIIAILVWTEGIH